MKNRVNDGSTIEHTAVGTAIESGDVVDLTNEVGIAVTDIAVGEVGVLCLGGRYNLPKDTALVITKGESVYWDAVNGWVDKTSTAQILVGRAAESATETADNIDVNLNQGSYNTPAEIVAAVESATISADAVTDGTTNHTFTALDDTKLGAIEASADVTDATNVAAAGAVMDSDITPGEGFLRKTGSGAYTAHKSNLAATTAPVVTDDTAAGYSVGSKWYDVTNDIVYTCVDATNGAAVWLRIVTNANILGASKIYHFSYTVVADDDTANLTNIDTGLGAGPLAGWNVNIYRSDEDVKADAKVTNPSTDILRIADGGATYVLTTGDKIMGSAWIA